MHKILFITRKWAPAIGGMEIYSQRLAKALACKCLLSVRYLPGSQDGRPPPKKWTAIFLFSSLGYLLRNKSFQIIHLGDLVLWPLGLAGALCNSSARVVVTVHGLDVVYGLRRGVLPKLYRLYLQACLRLMRHKLHIIANSQATADLCQKIGFTNIRVIQLGVDPPRCFPFEQARVEPYVLFIGRLVRRKGAGWFAENVLPLLDENIRMVVVGQFWDAAEQAIIMGHERVDYRGVVGDKVLLTLRRRAVAVVMPNIPGSDCDIEGFGLTALEAAADGGVLLASGIEGIRDAVIHNRTGYLLPTQDPASWARKINTINAWSLADRYRFVRNAQESIRKHYSWELMAENTVKFYAASLQGSP
jgi:phosphatidylinositol alpha-1,6-mannosyltransferase